MDHPDLGNESNSIRHKRNSVGELLIMAWDKNEVAVLGLVLIIGAILVGIGKMDPKIMEISISTIVGYAAGRIFNHAQGKE